MTDDRQQDSASVVGAFLVASAVCAALVIYRIAATDSLAYYWLIFPNLVLSWIPFLCGLGLRREFAAGRPGLARAGALGLIWLAFLPNAPYIITDMVHLTGVPVFLTVQFDIAVIGLAALIGLMQGFLSLHWVHEIVAGRLGRGLGWAFATAVWFLCAVGIYLGRELRWNSWDLVRAPGRVILDVLQIFQGGVPLHFVATFTALLVSGYLVFRACLLVGVQSEGR